MRNLREQAAEHGAHLALLLLPAARLLALGLPRRLLELPLLARLPARGVAALGHVGLQPWGTWGCSPRPACVKSALPCARYGYLPSQYGYTGYGDTDYHAIASSDGRYREMQRDTGRYSATASSATRRSTLCRSRCSTCGAHEEGCTGAVHGAAAWGGGMLRGLGWRIGAAAWGGGMGRGMVRRASARGVHAATARTARGHEGGGWVGGGLLFVAAGAPRCTPPGRPPARAPASPPRSAGWRGAGLGLGLG